MDCDHEGCEKHACATTSHWISEEGLHVKYWCKEHAPQGDETLEWFCWANALVFGVCPTCELKASK